MQYFPQYKSRLISQIVDWMTEQKEFQNLIEKYLQPFKEKAIDMDFPHNPVSALMETLIFEAKTSKNISFFDLFLTNVKLNETDFLTYSQWKDKTIFSVFCVESVRAGEFLNLYDIFSNQHFKVYDISASQLAKPGFTLISRILPFENDWIFGSGLMDVLATDVNDFMIKKLSQLENMSELEYFVNIYSYKFLDEEENEDNERNLIQLQERLQKEKLPKIVVEFCELISKKKFKVPEEMIFDILKKGKTDFSLASKISTLFSWLFEENEIPMIQMYGNMIWNKYQDQKPRIRNEAKKEIELKDSFMNNLNEDEYHMSLSDKDRTIRANELFEKWLETPLIELENKTPKVVILEERKKNGVSDTNIGIHITADRFFVAPDLTSNEAKDFFDDAIKLRKEDYDFEAIQKFAIVFAHIVKNNPELIGKWFFEVSKTLLGLGFFDEAKFFSEKALKFNFTKEKIEKLKLKIEKETKIDPVYKFIYRAELIEYILIHNFVFRKEVIPEEIPLIANAKALFNYISKNKVTLTAKEKKISRKIIRDLNNKLPFAKEIKLADDERYFNELRFLHVLLNITKLTKEKDKVLSITSKGKSVLKSGTAEIFDLLFINWFNGYAWNKLWTEKMFSNSEIDSIRCNWIKSGSNEIESIKYYLLKKILENSKKDWFSLELFEELKKKSVFSVIHTNVKRYFLTPLEWFGILESKIIEEPDRSKRKISAEYSEKFYEETDLLSEEVYIEKQWRLTEFGEYVFNRIEDGMVDCIPFPIRAMIDYPEIEPVGKIKK